MIALLVILLATFAIAKPIGENHPIPYNTDSDSERPTKMQIIDIRTLRPNFISAIHSFKQSTLPEEMSDYLSSIEYFIEEAEHKQRMLQILIKENIYPYYAFLSPKDEVLSLLGQQEDLTHELRAIRDLHSSDCSPEDVRIAYSIEGRCISILQQLDEMGILKPYSAHEYSLIADEHTTNVPEIGLNIVRLIVTDNVNQNEPLKLIENLHHLKVLIMYCSGREPKLDYLREIDREARGRISSLKFENCEFSELDEFVNFWDLKILHLIGPSTHPVSLLPLMSIWSLKKLHISSFSNVDDWNDIKLIPQLTELYLEDNNLPESLDFKSSEYLQILRISNSPQLQYLNLLDCPQLTSLELIKTNVELSRILILPTRRAIGTLNPGEILITLVPQVELSLAPIVVDRNDLYDSAKNTLLGVSPNHFGITSVVYANELGQDDGGVTRDFITKLSIAMVNPIHGIFQHQQIVEASNDPQDMLYYFDKYDSTKIEDYEFIGKFLAFAYIKETPLAIVFRPLFFKLLVDPTVELSLQDLQDYDKELYNSLSWLLQNPNETERDHEERIVALDLTFCDQNDGSPIHPDIDSNTQVTSDNHEQYITLIVNYLAKGKYQESIDAISQAFTDTLSYADFQDVQRELTPQYDINVEEWIDNLDVQDFEDNQRIKNMFADMLRHWKQSHDQKKLRDLLELSTGQHMPSTGFQYLNFSLRKEPNAQYPIAHTCSNQLNIKEYQSYEELVAGLEAAIENFRLSNGLMTIA